MRFIIQWTVKFWFKESVHMKTAQLWVFCSCWIFLITDLIRSTKQHQPVHLKWLCTTAKPMELISAGLGSACFFARRSDNRVKLIPCAKAHHKICTALKSPLSLIFGLTGDFRSFCAVEWPAGHWWIEPYAVRKAFRAEEELLFCQGNKDAPAIYFPARIAKLMLIKFLKHRTE